ncbi:hypothetical protein [Tenacibaculum agarivorans]|uniref:hypothetical protein n=1 Tax=Tenacibaculum agarivorans TaxID=1908389 RepID=UPI00094BBA28|nr:hypothetical protein [Tenacibaculum agarivorans]
MTSKVLKLAVAMLFGGLLMISCSDEEGTTSVEDLNTEEIQDAVVLEDITSDLDDFLEYNDFDRNEAAKGIDPSKSSIADCVTRTVEIDEVNQTITVTLDFGEGCVGPRGREFAGKIVIVYTRVDESFSKEVTFDGFSVDGNQIEGSKSVVKVKENAEGNKEKTRSIAITVTLVSGEVVSMEGTRTYEKTEGDETRTKGDDVYLISGNWEFVNKDGETFAGDIKEKLRREFACRYIVSGVTEITKNGEVYTLDFGDGTCDNVATVTNAAGETREISLRKK